MEMQGYETIIGDGRHLTEYMQNLIKQGKITESQAMSIKDRLKNRFDGGYIKEEELMFKAHEMFSDFQFEYEWFFRNVLANEESCPICLEKMDYKEGICQNCAFNVSMVNLDLKNFQDMDKFANFVESHDSLRDTRDMLLKNGYGGDHLYTDLLSETYLDDDLKMEYDNLHLNEWVDLDELMGYDNEYNSDERDDVRCISEMDVCRAYEYHKYRLIPRKDDSYVMPVELRRFQLYSNVEKYNDMERALENLDFAPSDLMEQLKDQSFQEGYLTHDASKANWHVFSKSISTTQLKMFLKKHGGDTSGSREELISRIFESDFPLDEFVNYRTFLTQKAYDFLKEHEWIQFYIGHLGNYDFLEFKKYFESHEGSVEDIALDYLDEHVRLTLESLDFNYIMRTNLARSIICHLRGNLEEALISDIRMFLLNMNPVCFDMRFASSFSLPYFPIYITHLKELKSELGEEAILESFNQNWNYMNFDSIIIPKKETKNILIAALNSDDDSWSREVYEEYFRMIFGQNSYHLLK